VEALDLDGYHVYHAIRAALLGRLGRTANAADAYDRAIARTGNAAEQAYLRRARDHLR
jgi:RNA polymerase sigma-70 factor (ECF subfamily)